MKAYSELTTGDADRCACAYCRNYAAQLIKPGERPSDVASTKFQYWFVEAIRLPKPEADFGSKVLAVEFYTTSFAALQR
jgi:hypothetical protein